MRTVDLARVCHEANRAYCLALGDTSQLDWDSAPEWQRSSAVKGVEFNLANPHAPASRSHDCWLEEKRATGWKYGPVKDPEKKEHPCFVSYESLPEAQKYKDHLFKSICTALAGAVVDGPEVR